MRSSNFVKRLMENSPKKAYVQENESWQNSVARVLLTGILKNQFYRSADDAAKEAFPLFINAAKTDPMFLLKAACFARNSHMKGMVKVALAAIAGHASDEFLSQENVRMAAIGLLSTFHPGQLIQFVELMKSKSFGRGFGSRPQKWVRAAMESWSEKKLENFTLKYPQALNQLVRLVHPRYKDSAADDNRYGIIKYVLDGKKSEATGNKQKVVEELKRLPSTEEARIAIATAMIDHDIPWDVVKGFAGLDGPLALSCMTQMGLTALLLNMRSLENHGVLETSEGTHALSMKLKEVQDGRSIPLDFAKPYIYCNNSNVKNMLLDAMAKTLSVPMPAIESKKIGVSIDISGSMQGETLKTAGLLAVPFLKAKDLWLTTFDTALYEEGVTVHSYYGGREGVMLTPRVKGVEPREAIRSLLDLKVHGGTDVAVSVNEATRKRRHLDIHVLITDEQQNSGSYTLRESWNNYRNIVNPEAQLWVINATNYQWHSADFGDPSVVVYQSMTPAIFKNIQFAGQNLTKTIEDFDLSSMIRR